MTIRRKDLRSLLLTSLALLALAGCSKAAPTPVAGPKATDSPALATVVAATVKPPSTATPVLEAAKPTIVASSTAAPVPAQAWVAYVTRVWDGEDAKALSKEISGHSRDGWRLVYLDTVVGDGKGAWHRFSGRGNDPRATVIDSKGYTREAKIFHQPYGLESRIEFAPPLFRMNLRLQVELPDNPEYRPDVITLLMADGEQLMVSASAANPSLAIPLDPAVDPSKRNLGEMTPEVQETWGFNLGKVGEPYVVRYNMQPTGLIATVKGITISDRAESGQERSEASVVIIPEVEYKNEGGYDAQVSLQAVVIDSHGHVSGPSRYSTGLDHGIADGGTLPPGRSAIARLTAPLRHPIEQVDFVWVLLWFNSDEGRIFYVER